MFLCEKKYAVKVEIYELIVNMISKHKYEPVDVTVSPRLFEMAVVEFKGDSCCLFGAV